MTNAAIAWVPVGIGEENRCKVSYMQNCYHKKWFLKRRTYSLWKTLPLKSELTARRCDRLPGKRRSDSTVSAWLQMLYIPSGADWMWTPEFKEKKVSEFFRRKEQEVEICWKTRNNRLGTRDNRLGHCTTENKSLTSVIPVTPALARPSLNMATAISSSKFFTLLRSLMIKQTSVDPDFLNGWGSLLGKKSYDTNQSINQSFRRSCRTINWPQSINQSIDRSCDDNYDYCATEEKDLDNQQDWIDTKKTTGIMLEINYDILHN